MESRGYRMKLIVGLGNPGKEYEQTRHNAGFMVLDEIAKRLSLTFSNSKLKGLLAKTTVGNEVVYFLKPMTYMNLSGEAVRSVMDFYQIPLENILVIYDDKDTEVGKLRLRYQGSAGGQNGMKNIINHVHSQNFNRIRVGIGSNNGENMANFVLGKMDKKTKEEFDKAIELAADAALESLTHNFEDVMNKYNRK